MEPCSNCMPKVDLPLQYSLAVIRANCCNSIALSLVDKYSSLKNLSFAHTISLNNVKVLTSCLACFNFVSLKVIMATLQRSIDKLGLNSITSVY